MSETKTSQSERLHQQTNPLEGARHLFYEIAGHVDDVYTKRNIDIDNVPKTEYWMAVTETANRLSRNEYSTPDRLAQGAALELTAAVPYFMLAERALAVSEHPSAQKMSKESLNGALYFVSHFNQLIRNYALANPSITALDLNKHISSIAAQSEVTRHPERMQSIIARVIAGAQHELAGTQILQTIGEVRDPTTQEDLEGIDCVMKYRGKSLGIDIAASHSTVGRKSKGAPQPMAIVRGRVILYSQLTDEDLDGRFFVNESVIKRKAPLLENALQQAIRTPNLRPITFDNERTQQPRDQQNIARALGNRVARVR